MFYKFYERQDMTSFFGHCIFTIHDLMDGKDWNPCWGLISTQPSVPSEWLSFAYLLLIVYFINFNRKEGVILYISKMTHGDYSLKVFNFYILYRYKYMIRKVLSRINDKHFLLQIRRGIRIISKWIMRYATYHK